MSLLCYVEVNIMKMSVISMCGIIFIFKVISKIFSKNIKCLMNQTLGLGLQTCCGREFVDPIEKASSTSINNQFERNAKISQ